MKRLEFSLKSLEDLTSILEYIARDRPLASVRFVESIELKCEVLARHPHLGMKRDDLATGVRLFAFRGYGIYYRELADAVRVERVLHGALDVASVDFD